MDPRKIFLSITHKGGGEKEKKNAYFAAVREMKKKSKEQASRKFDQSRRRGSPSLCLRLQVSSAGKQSKSRSLIEPRGNPTKKRWICIVSVLNL